MRGWDRGGGDEKQECLASQAQGSQEDSQEERKVEAQGEGGWSGFHRPLMGWVVGSHLKGQWLQGQELSAYGTDS